MHICLVSMYEFYAKYNRLPAILNPEDSQHFEEIFCAQYEAKFSKIFNSENNDDD